VEELQALLGAVDHQRIGRISRAAAGRHEDDVEDAEGVHHAQNQRQERGRQQQRQNDKPKPLRRRGAVDGGRLENIGRQRLEAGQKDQRGQWRPFPGVDRHQRRKRAVRFGEQAARARQAEFGEGVAERPVFRTQQRLEDEAHHQRRHGRGNEEEAERDAVEQIVAPQQQRDAEAENKLDGDRAEREDEGVDERGARVGVAPQRDVIVEPDKAPRRRMGQVIALEGIEKALNHRPDGDRQHVGQRRRGEGGQEEPALARIGEPAGRPDRARSPILQDDAHPIVDLPGRAFSLASPMGPTHGCCDDALEARRLAVT